MLRLLPAGLAIGAALWAATLVAAPYALMSGNPRLVSAAATLYSGAGLICHQRAARSFHLAGAQLPVCGRCTGLYFSGALGGVLAWISRRPRVPSNTRRILLLAAIPTALSVVLEWRGLLDPSNLGRALCALPLGAIAAWIFVQSLRAEALPNRDLKKTDMITEVVSKPTRNDLANERASEPTRAERGKGAPASKRVGESEGRSPSGRR